MPVADAVNIDQASAERLALMTLDQVQALTPAERQLRVERIRNDRTTLWALGDIQQFFGVHRLTTQEWRTEQVRRDRLREAGHADEVDALDPGRALPTPTAEQPSKGGRGPRGPRWPMHVIVAVWGPKSHRSDEIDLVPFAEGRQVSGNARSARAA